MTAPHPLHTFGTSVCRRHLNASVRDGASPARWQGSIRFIVDGVRHEVAGKWRDEVVSLIHGVDCGKPAG
jgi:hypothetical protein